MTQCECVCVSCQLELVTSELVNHLSRHWHYLEDSEVRSPSHRRLQVDGAMAIVLARRVGLLLDILQRTQWSTPSPENLSSEKTNAIIAEKAPAISILIGQLKGQRAIQSRDSRSVHQNTIIFIWKKWAWLPMQPFIRNPFATVNARHVWINSPPALRWLLRLSH